MNPQILHSDYIDGAWWPRTADLTVELPDLLAALRIRVGAVNRIVYDQHTWSSPPWQTIVAGREIRLEPYPFRLPNTLYVIGADATVIVLRVIASSTDEATANTELTAATGPAV
ncbi:DUF5994 family protein [Nocardia acidivorans]|uniref:DUF5994 family protein n=1 Tax=Nocardia acidivorans TaxID=404580 RepID=UPI000837957B|nr:DUF5994 family protein [Nocardia acidivorans]